MKQALFVIAFLYLSSFVAAQTVLLDQDVNADTVKPTWGKNLVNYNHFFVNVGLFMPQNQSVNLLKSYEYAVGYRYKRRITNHYALGFDAALRFSTFNIKQDSARNLPYSGDFKSEHFNANAIDLSFYNRINFGKRGNMIGSFIDLGVAGNYVFYVTQKSKFKTTNGENVKAKYDISSVFEPLNYHAFCRIGRERWALFANYRLSDIFKKSYHYQELPALVVGLEIGLE